LFWDYIKNIIATQYRKYFIRSKLISRSGERNLYKTRFGDLFWLTRRSYVDQCIINTGVFEDFSTAVVKQLVKKGDVVLDIGANIGYYSVLFSRLVGVNGKIMCFEPTEHYRNVLRKNIEVNNLVNVEVFDFGFSNKEQTLKIEIGDSSATIHSPGGVSLNKTELIKLVRLDNFVQEHNIAKIDFIKIDVDGHEPLFFEGAWKTLERFDPIILSEISHLHFLEAGFTAWDYFDMLKKKQYRIYHEDGLREITTKEDFLIKCGNFAYSANIILSKRGLDI
jgi:FkbM family methyltransferase